jgi:hypothetical protein
MYEYYRHAYFSGFLCSLNAESMEYVYGTFQWKHCCYFIVYVAINTVYRNEFLRHSSVSNFQAVVCNTILQNPVALSRADLMFHFYLYTLLFHINCMQ